MPCRFFRGKPARLWCCAIGAVCTTPWASWLGYKAWLGVAEVGTTALSHIRSAGPCPCALVRLMFPYAACCILSAVGTFDFCVVFAFEASTRRTHGGHGSAFSYPAPRPRAQHSRRLGMPNSDLAAQASWLCRERDPILAETLVCHGCLPAISSGLQPCFREP